MNPQYSLPPCICYNIFSLRNHSFVQQKSDVLFALSINSALVSVQVDKGSNNTLVKKQNESAQTYVY